MHVWIGNKSFFTDLGKKIRVKVSDCVILGISYMDQVQSPNKQQIIKHCRIWRDVTMRQTSGNLSPNERNLRHWKHISATFNHVLMSVVCM